MVSDVVCPWCYIGKRRLEKAIESLKLELQFEVNYLPFELNPGMPKQGRNQKEYLTEKFGGEERYKQLTENVSKIASEEGLKFDYMRQHVSPNTRNAHRLIWLAGTEGCQGQVKEALMNAYFQQGINLSKNENLLDIVSDAGLERKKAEALLNSEEGLVEVEYLEQINQKRGINGVPYYIINHKYGISGAQPPSTFIKAFKDISLEISKS